MRNWNRPSSPHFETGHLGWSERAKTKTIDSGPETSRQPADQSCRQGQLRADGITRTRSKIGR